MPRGQFGVKFPCLKYKAGRHRPENTQFVPAQGEIPTPRGTCVSCGQPKTNHFPDQLEQSFRDKR